MDKQSLRLMKVLHVGPLNVKSGGPTLSTYLAMKGVESHGYNPAILTMPLAHDDKWYATDVPIHLTTNPIDKKYSYIWNYKSQLSSLPLYDIMHIQGLWLHLFHGAISFARANKIPYIVSLRGTMYPQALQINHFVKSLFRKLFQDRDLLNAACIHATCEDELNFYRQLGFKNPVAVIPNSIDISSINEPTYIRKDIFTIGFLGRVHPRKRVEKLIYSLKYLKENGVNAKLKIIGADDPEYEAFLRAETKDLGLLNDVEFTGFLVGDEKEAAISSLSVLGCASDFENFGNMVTEALVRGVPVMATKGMPWQCLEAARCGWWVENNQDSLNKTLLNIARLSEEELREYSLNGRKLIKDRFSTEAVGKQFAMLYDWILNKAVKPSFVY